MLDSEAKFRAENRCLWRTEHRISRVRDCRRAPSAQTISDEMQRLAYALLRCFMVAVEEDIGGVEGGGAPVAASQGASAAEHSRQAARAGCSLSTPGSVACGRRGRSWCSIGVASSAAAERRPCRQSGEHLTRGRRRDA